MQQKIYEIIWNDIESHNTINTIEEAKKLIPIVVRSIGYIVKQDANYIIIASTEYKDGCVSEINTIPIGCIIKIIPIRHKLFDIKKIPL